MRPTAALPTVRCSRNTVAARRFGLPLACDKAAPIDEGPACDIRSNSLIPCWGSSARKRAVHALFNSRTYCNLDVMETIIRTAMERKAAGDFMHFAGAPWWVQRRLYYETGVSPCVL
jgi:hypothetical protein